MLIVFMLYICSAVCHKATVAQAIKNIPIKIKNNIIIYTIQVNMALMMDLNHEETS
jgi:hypothetical protein